MELISNADRVALRWRLKLPRKCIAVISIHQIGGVLKSKTGAHSGMKKIGKPHMTGLCELYRK